MIIRYRIRLTVLLIPRGCTGFDREHAVGEAIRMRCVKWQK